MEHLPKEETIRLRDKYIGQSCQLFFRNDPLKIVRGERQYLFDEQGERYLDCMNNVAHVGHCHPDVVRAGCEQMAQLCTNNRFLHDEIVLCAQRLVSTMPEELSVCYFVNSGSEANDLALRLAQIHTGRRDVIALEHAYHGHLTSLIDISHYKFSLPGGVGQKEHVHIAPAPDTYRGKYRDTEHSADTLGRLYADEVGALCDNLVARGSGPSAFIAESMLSCGGQIIPPKGYFNAVYEHVRKAGGVCIADEVQVGFGRVGSHWWTFQMYDVVPDIVTVGKPMGNGHPASAVITTKAIAESFNATGVEYFNTFGGNPVTCAIANAVFDVIEKERLRDNALDTGAYLLEKFEQLARRYNVIGDVRGVGLFVGIELVLNRTTREPATKIAKYIQQRLRDEKILMSTDGPYSSVLKLKPPMVFSRANADQVVEALERILEEFKDLVPGRTRTESYSKEAQRSYATTNDADVKSI